MFVKDTTLPSEGDAILEQGIDVEYQYSEEATPYIKTF